MRNVLFYGASVTAQTGSTGYFEHVKNALSNIGVTASRTAYGGCHIDDAGFYRFESTLSADFSHVVFEWNTTGLNVYNELKISHLLLQLSRKKIKPIFIILPQEATINGNRNSENQIYFICKRFGLPLLDVREGLSADDFKKMVRDVVHTNEVGAHYYANKIFDFFKSLVVAETQYWMEFDRFEDQSLNLLTPKVLTTDITLQKGDVLEININSFSKIFSEIIIRHKIGPYSPVVTVSDGAILRKLSLWDSYCHYEREHFSILINNQDFIHSCLRSPLSYRICISNESPRYELCRRENVDFNIDKLIKINEFYSLGIDFNFSIIRCGV